MSWSGSVFKTLRHRISFQYNESKNRLQRTLEKDFQAFLTSEKSYGRTINVEMKNPYINSR